MDRYAMEALEAAPAERTLQISGWRQAGQYRFTVHLSDEPHIPYVLQFIRLDELVSFLMAAARIGHRLQPVPDADDPYDVTAAFMAQGVV